MTTQKLRDSLEQVVVAQQVAVVGALVLQGLQPALQEPVGNADSRGRRAAQHLGSGGAATVGRVVQDDLAASQEPWVLRLTHGALDAPSLWARQAKLDPGQ